MGSTSSPFEQARASLLRPEIEDVFSLERDSGLTRRERFLVGLRVAALRQHTGLTAWFQARAQEEGATPAEIDSVAFTEYAPYTRPRLRSILSWVDHIVSHPDSSLDPALVKGVKWVELNGPELNSLARSTRVVLAWVDAPPV